MTTVTESAAGRGTDTVLAGVLPAVEEKIEEQVERYRLPGVAVGIVRDQELAWSGGFGFADIEGEQLPDEHTLYRVGSITKTFTATAIVQLRDEGRLSLDDPLVRHIPEFGAARNRFGSIEDVTLRRMLAPRSGLMGEPPLSHWETLSFPTIEEIIASLPRVDVRSSRTPPSSTPTSPTRYSARWWRASPAAHTWSTSTPRSSRRWG